MKLLGVRADPLSGVRRRAALQVAAENSGQSAATSRSGDTAAFLGLTPADMTPPVKAALATLLTEIDELRREVGLLKGRLNEAEDLADKDGLTPVLNRRAFVRELQRVITFAQRFDTPSSLVYFDLDGFKAVNDRFGHAAGDAALKAVAERLAVAVRDGDVVGRLGGDEFGVILTQADLGTGLAKAASLAQTIEAEPASYGDWLAPLHVSYGVREIEAGLTAEQHLAEADAAMYARKRSASASAATG